MIDSDLRFKELLSALKERDFRLTPQRVELVRLIASSEGHPSANEFYERIKKKFPTMSHATVYKTLALLKEMNQVFEINLRGDSHYDGNRPVPHPHLICTRCNKITDGEIDLVQESIKKLAETSGYLIQCPQVMLYGICPECREKM
jgi:Fur family peroxide stress response transcriptional regulator